MTHTATQQVQLLYEISMAIADSLQLDEMLKTSLRSFLRKLNGSAGGVYALAEDGNGQLTCEEVYTIPRKANRNEAYQAAFKKLSTLHTSADLETFRKTLPLQDKSSPDKNFYIFDLPKFGLMIFVKHGTRLDELILKSLTPLCIKLARACRACLSNEAVIAARDQAVQASRLKSQLLANVSHDLRTPLNAILGFGEMLEAEIYGPITSEQLEATNRIIDSTAYLINLVNQLLDEAQLESGTLTLHQIPFSPKTLINQVISQTQLTANQKDLKLVSEFAPDLPTTLIGDQARIQQIVSNLVGNAIKFTANGGVTIRVFQPKVKYWSIEVTDTGVGISAQAQDYIFDPFRQVDGSATRKYAGTGLGLSIVKQLTELMRGNITLTSKENQGSTFTVTLPLKQKM